MFESRAFFQAAHGRWNDDYGAGTNQNFSAARHQGVHLVSSRRSLLTLEDNVLIFQSGLELKLSAQGEKDLVAFMRVL